MQSVVRRLFVSLVASVSFSVAAPAALVVSPGYHHRVVYDTGPGAVSGGLSADNGQAVFFGVGTQIFAWPAPFTGAVVSAGSIPPNTDISAVSATGSTIFVGSGVSYSPPYVHKFGRLDGGVYSNLFQLDGLFDSAVGPDGSIFLSANPANAGEQLFRFDAGSNAPVAIGIIGGYSGGLTLDAAGNLFYAEQNSGDIWRFSAADVAAGNLSPSQAQAVVSMPFAAYLANDGKRLLATTQFGNEIDAYDLATGSFLETIATDDAFGYGVGKLAWNAASREIVMSYTDWGSYRSLIIALRKYTTDRDYTGAHHADAVVYDKATGRWRIRSLFDSTTTSGVTKTTFRAGLTPVQGDFDGDGKTDLAAFNKNDGRWYIRLSSSGTEWIISWGGSTYVPVPSDYDGDGKTDLAVFQPTTGNWFVRRSTDASIFTTNWGGSKMTPVPADYDGDGKADFAVYQPTNGNWYIRQSSDGTLMSGAPISTFWHKAVPVPGDYDGDGKADIAAYNYSTSEWQILLSSDGARGFEFFGRAGTSKPVPGDYDGDGKTDIAVYNESTGLWYFDGSRAGFTRFPFGGPGFKAVWP